LEKNI